MYFLLSAHICLFMIMDLVSKTFLYQSCRLPWPLPSLTSFQQVKNLDTVLAKAKRDKDKAKNCPNTLTKEYVDDKFAEQARLLRTIASKFDVLAERSDPGTPLSPVPPSYSYSTSSTASAPGPGLYSTSSSPSSASSSWTVTGDDMSDPLESVNSQQGRS